MVIYEITLGLVNLMGKVYIWGMVDNRPEIGGTFQPGPYVGAYNVERFLEQAIQSPQTHLTSPSERGAQKWSWKWTLLNVGGAFASGAVSFWVGEHLWPDLPAIGLRALAIGFGVTIGGFLVPTMVYNRIHFNTWFGRR